MSLTTPPSESQSLSSLFSLTGKLCVITGGTRGIGFEIAKAYAEASCAGLALLYSGNSTSSTTQASNAVSYIQSTYKATLIKAYAADVSKSSEIEAVMDLVKADFGRIDVLVVNAGVYVDGELNTGDKGMSDETVTGMVGVNLIMKENSERGGSIIFTASNSGHQVLRPQREAVYCATKAAVLQLSRAFAVEFADHNIRVNSVSPGYIDTEMNDLLMERHPGQDKIWLADNPARRFCKVWELKGIYVFLASAASSYITGADHKVDGAHLPLIDTGLSRKQSNIP